MSLVSGLLDEATDLQKGNANWSTNRSHGASFVNGVNQLHDVVRTMPLVMQVNILTITQ